MISVVGAGPVGSYVAERLAKEGKEVNLFEEHDKIGVPVQCTGILTNDFGKFVDIKKEFLINKIKRVKVHSPGNSVGFKLKNENYVISREKFDGYLAEKAVDSGVKLFKKHKLVDVKEGDKLKLKFSNGKSVDSDYLIGADGPRSVVARSVNMFEGRKFTIALQANVKGEYEKDLVDFYIGKEHFGWVVPESEKVARIGVTSYRKTKYYFDSLMKVTGGKILNLLGGSIPVYNSRFRTQKDNVYVVGDAAGHVKTSTHGGIIPGIVAGEELVKSLVDGGSYEKMWKKKIGKDLLLHLWIRKIMDKFSVKECDELVEYCKNKKVNKLIEDFDREFPSKYIMKVAFAKPQFLKYGLKLFS